MKNSIVFLFAFITISFLVSENDGLKILGVFPTMAKSHYIVGSSLMKGLAEKGHDVTVISPFPQKKPLKNYRDVTSETIVELSKGMMVNLLQHRHQKALEMFTELFSMGEMITNVTMQEDSVQKLLRSNEKFDVVVMEVFVNEAMLGFAERFNAPVVGVSTFGASLWTCEMVGTPSPPSYVPTPFSGFTDKMNFLQRLGNFMMITIERLIYNYYHMPKQEALYKKYFPNAKKSLSEMIHSVSLVLLNNHVSLNYPRPYAINMIEVGGMHINRETNPLPENMQKFLDSAKDGAIYFSMGSNLQGRTLDKDKVETILKVFGSLKQKVLWKWEDPTLPGKPNNVLISDWFPQNDILAHPNIKLFITHGGLLSTTEAVYFGVPIVAIPIFGDQPLNAARAEQSGMGRALAYDDLNEQTFREVITDVLNRESFYGENVKKMSVRYRDQPRPPLETAVYWVEYVGRHQGAPHLHSAGTELNFIQYHSLDILALFLVIDIIIIYLEVKLVKRFCCSSKKRSIQKRKGD